MSSSLSRLTITILAGLTARAVVILIQVDQVVYTELVSEIADEPNYEEAWNSVRDS